MRFGVYSGDPFLAERALRRRLAQLGEAERILLWGDEAGAEGVLEALGTPLLFGGGKLRAVVVRRADPLAGDQRLIKALRSGPPEGVALFLLGEEIKGPLANAAEEFIHFRKPTKTELRELAVELMREAGLRVHGFVVDMLVEACGGDAMRLAREIEKLSLWKGGKLPRDRIPELFYFAEPAPFGFLEGIGWRDLTGALRELSVLLKRGWDPQRIFFLLAGQVRALLLARAALDGEAQPEGPDWLWRRRLQQAKGFTKKELLELLCLLQELDLKIKRGEMTPNAALYLFTLRAVPGVP
ncbi:DNA polymerase III subunit delta [Candidatus Bipolaricaulota sp. J31]